MKRPGVASTTASASTATATSTVKVRGGEDATGGRWTLGEHPR